MTAFDLPLSRLPLGRRRPAPQTLSWSHITQAIEPDPLQQGDRGLPVERLQLALRHLGHYGGELDGQFGPTTAAAVSALQHTLGLAPTGAFDQATWYGLSFWSQP